MGLSPICGKRLAWSIFSRILLQGPTVPEGVGTTSALEATYLNKDTPR